MTFCLFCCFNCHEVCEMKLQLIILPTNGTYGSGSLANLLGRVSELHVCVPSQYSSLHVVYMHLVYKFTAVQQQKQAASRR